MNSFLQDSDSISGTKLQYTLPIFIFIGCAGVSILLTFILIGISYIIMNNDHSYMLAMYVCMYVRGACV
jgi:hypothetical protein